MSDFKALVQFPADTKIGWELVDPVIPANVLVLETGGGVDGYYQFKIGDGVRKYSELPYGGLQGEPGSGGGGASTIAGIVGLQAALEGKVDKASGASLVDDIKVVKLDALPDAAALNALLAGKQAAESGKGLIAASDLAKLSALPDVNGLRAMIQAADEFVVEVETAAELPLPPAYYAGTTTIPAAKDAAWVKTATGTVLTGGRKPAGAYIFDGTSWNVSTDYTTIINALLSVQGALGGKVDAADVYPKTQTYTQAEVDTLLAAKQQIIAAQAFTIGKLNVFTNMTI